MIEPILTYPNLIDALYSAERPDRCPKFKGILNAYWKVPGWPENRVFLGCPRCKWIWRPE